VVSPTVNLIKSQVGRKEKETINISFQKGGGSPAKDCSK